MNDRYLSAMNDCKEKEAESYWEKLEDNISKMTPSQQKRAIEYQFYVAENLALTEMKEKLKIWH
jgi:hypothetical protein